MKTLALRIYLTVVAVLLVFTLGTGWLAKRHFERERQELLSQNTADQRIDAWAELIEKSLPGPDRPEAEQAAALKEWAKRLHLPMGLDSAEGKRIATSDELDELIRLNPQMLTRLRQVKLSDGRLLLIVRLGPLHGGPPDLLSGGRPQQQGRNNGPDQFGGPRGPGGPGGPGGPNESFNERANGFDGPPPLGPGGPGMGPDGFQNDNARVDGNADRGPRGDRNRVENGPSRTPFWLAPLAWLTPPAIAVGGASGMVLSLVLLFVAVAVGAWPVANHLTRRIKALRQGVETFGSGQLQHRVEVEGRDEVAALASSFNQAAQQIEDLVTSHRTLLANASHELRSPLARLKMATAMLTELPPERTDDLRREINRDISELDALVEEVLLASRLDARPTLDLQPINLKTMGEEEAERTGARVVIHSSFKPDGFKGDDRLVRRAMRNLLENAKRYGGNTEPVELHLTMPTPQRVQIQVCDRGPGVPVSQRDRIFEPFYRMPGHAEHAGGVGLGLSLVKQIAVRHGGDVRCEDRLGGGSCFIIELPLHPPGQ